MFRATVTSRLGGCNIKKPNQVFKVQKKYWFIPKKPLTANNWGGGQLYQTGVVLPGMGEEREEPKKNLLLNPPVSGCSGAGWKTWS